MSPALYLLALSTLMVAAVVTSAVIDLLRSHRFHRAARDLGLQFSRPDRFLLAPRVAVKLPVPGAAEVRVSNVAYRSIKEPVPSTPGVPSPTTASAPTGLLCVMVASFTIGSVGRRKNIRRVCAALDPGGRELLAFQMLDEKPKPQTYERAFRELLIRTA